MLKKSTNIRKFQKLVIPHRQTEIADITGSLSSITPPAKTKFVPGIRQYNGGSKVVKQEKEISTGSLENLQPPVKKFTETGIKENPTPITYIPNINTLNNFDQEIFEYSARYIQKHIDWWNEEENSITLANTLLDYGTEGPGPENFEVIINGIHSPLIYDVKQDGINVIVTFNERLFSYDGLEKENVIIIGKLLDIALLTERLTDNSVVITDENGQALIL